jgi:glycosyltransferase 2 family protein
LNEAQLDTTCPRPRRKWIVLGAKMIIAAGVLCWLCSGRLDFGRLAAVPLSLDLVVLAAIVFSSLLLPAIRWWWLLRIQRVEASMWQAVRLTWIAYATAIILPGAASGDLAKSILIVRGQPGARARSLSTVLVDRLIGIYSLILLGATSAGWYRTVHPDATFVKYLLALSAAMLVGSLCAAATVALGAWRRWFGRLAPAAWSQAWTESFHLYRHAPQALAGCLVLSLASSGLTAVSLTAADRALGGAVSWGSSLLVGPLVVLANCVPITPGGVGVAEATSSELFAQMGSANGAEMMMLVRLMMAALSLPALLLLFNAGVDRISSPARPSGKSAEPASTADALTGRSRAA